MDATELAAVQKRLKEIHLYATYGPANENDPDPFDEIRQAEFGNALPHEESEDKVLDPTKKLPFLPTEILTEIMSHTNPSDLPALRQTSKRFRFAAKSLFGKRLVNSRTLYPTYTSLSSFLALLLIDPSYPHLVRTLSLVSEHAAPNPYGYDWAWEELQNRERTGPTRVDRIIKQRIEMHHERWCASSAAFVFGGGYRDMLTIIFKRLPALQTIRLRKLSLGENIPGPDGIELLQGALQDLSFYRPGLPVNRVFYGEWQYDMVYQCITTLIDEYGDEYIWDGAGPQADCRADALAAVKRTKSKAVVVKTKRGFVEEIDEDSDDEMHDNDSDDDMFNEDDDD
ncbi:hypothetical protein COCMIDRAFT_39561 [Bipolaris oryzae ATCC 44560]|uniref:F-box domain-containing protein n=1 Tax=Bipolaris oryzae ATCC 44560 TaxID=930090 RepID=W6YSG6_COCMI|nr:uncharacterized protein COCMIDRAFT_39561 [Bipolaris oryzae ATCC 44560]EUC42392.1 hypothetical protein COCMIDRAFT_39561 [Bipolaris oryzae ATCC 44560]